MGEMGAAEGKDEVEVVLMGDIVTALDAGEEVVMGVIEQFSVNCNDEAELERRSSMISGPLGSPP